MPTSYDLIKARVIAFGYEAGVLVLGSIFAALLSPDFAALITAHFGTGITSSLVLLIVTGGIKHLRNLAHISAAGEELGSATGPAKPIVLI